MGLDGLRKHCWWTQSLSLGFWMDRVGIAEKTFIIFFIGISTVLHEPLLSLNMCRHCWTPSPSLGFSAPSVVPSMLSSLPTTQFVSRLVHSNYFLHCKLGKHIFHATNLKRGLFQWQKRSLSSSADPKFPLKYISPERKVSLLRRSMIRWVILLPRQLRWSAKNSSSTKCRVILLKPDQFLESLKTKQ